VEIQEDINIEGPPDGKAAVGQMLLRVRKTLGRASSTFDANEDVILSDKSNRDLLFNDLNKAYDKIGRPRLSRNDFDIAVVGRAEGTEPSKPVQVPSLLQPAKPSQGPSLTQITGQQVVTPMKPQQGPKTQQGPSLTDVTRQQVITPMKPEPQFQPFQFQNEKEIEQAAKSPVFLANKPAMQVLADREQMAQNNPLTWRQNEVTKKYGVFEKDAPIGSKPLAEFDNMNQAAEAIKTRGAASNALIMPTKEAEQEFQRMSPEEQQMAIQGGTGNELERQRADEKRSGFQKLKDFGKTIGGIVDNAYDFVVVAEKLIAAKQRDLLTFGGAEENLKKVKKEVISSMGKIENEYAQDLRNNNIQTSLVDAINKGELSKLPEAIAYNVASALISGIAAAYTGGYSMFAQTLAGEYKNGVENLARETNRTPEQVIADGDDAEFIPVASSMIQALIEKAQIGVASKAINSKGAYKFIRDAVINKVGKKSWARAAAAGAGIGVASLESGLQGTTQELTSMASEQASGSDSLNKFYKKLDKAFASEEGKKRLRESFIGEAVGAGGLIGGGRALNAGLNTFLKTPPSQLGGIPTQSVPNDQVITPEVVQGDGKSKFEYANTLEEIPQQYRASAKKRTVRTGMLGRLGIGPTKEIYTYEIPIETVNITNSQRIPATTTPVTTEAPQTTESRTVSPSGKVTYTVESEDQVPNQFKDRALKDLSGKISFDLTAEEDADLQSAQVKTPAIESDTTYVTATPEELEAYRNGTLTDQDRIAGIENDAMAIEQGAQTLEDLPDDPNYREMVRLKLAENQAATTSQQTGETAPLPAAEGATTSRATSRAIADIEVQREKELKHITPALEGRRGFLNINIAGKEVSANIGEGWTNIQDDIPLTPKEKKEVLQQFRLKDDGDLTGKEFSDWQRDFSKRVLQRISDEIHAKYNAQLAAIQSNATPAAAAPTTLDTKNIEVNGITLGNERIFGEDGVGDVRDKLPYGENNGTLVLTGKDGNKYVVAFSRVGGDGSNIFEKVGKETGRPGQINVAVRISDNATEQEIAAATAQAEGGLQVILPTIKNNFIDPRAIRDVLSNENIPLSPAATSQQTNQAPAVATPVTEATDQQVMDIISSANLTKDEKDILWRQYKKGVMDIEDVKRYSGVINIEGLERRGELDRFEKTGVNRGSGVTGEDVEFEEVDPEVRAKRIQQEEEVLQRDRLAKEEKDKIDSVAKKLLQQIDGTREIWKRGVEYGFDPNPDNTTNITEIVASAYQYAKDNGESPELVKAVEDLIGISNKTSPAPVTVATDETGGATTDAGTQPVVAESGRPVVEGENVPAPEQSPAQQIADLRAKEQAELDSKIKDADKYRGADGKVDRDKLTNDADRAAFDEVYERYNGPISKLLGKEPKPKAGSLRDVELTMRRPEKNEVIFVPIDALLEKQAADQPSYDIQKEGNRIKGRVEKAKQFLKNYLKDQRAINPKTGKRTNAKVSFEPSVVDIDADGKISFEDGRHRVLAAKELGLTEVPIEVPKGKGKAIQESLKQQQTTKTKGKESPKAIDRKATQALLDQANDELAAAKSAFDKKKAELNKTTKEDAPDLFGKRKVESGQGLFEMPRINPAQREKAIQPFRDRFEKAKAEVNRLTTLLNEGQEVTQELKFESDEQVQTTGTEVRKGKGGTKDEGPVRKKTPPVRNAGRTPDAIAARNVQFFGDPYYSSLQYVMDMTYHPDLLQSIFGGPDKNAKSGRKNIEGERKSRIQFLDKKSNIKTADRLGELLAEKYAEDNNISVREAEEKHNFRDIAETIILNHNSRNQMVKAILDQNDMVENQYKFQYDPEGIYGEDFNEDAAKDVDNSLDDIPDSYWEGMDLTDEQYNELFAPESESPFTDFQTKGEAARKAREALKKRVGVEEYNRMEAAYLNEKEKAKTEKEEAAKQEKKEEEEKEEDTTPLSAAELTGNKIIEEASSETEEGKSEYEDERDQKVSFTEALKADVKAFLSNGFDGIKKYSKKAQAYIQNISNKVVRSAIIAITAGGTVFGVGSKLNAESDGGLAINTISFSGMSQMVNRGLTKMGLLDIDVNEGKVDTKTITKQIQETVPVKDGVDFTIRGSVVDNRDPTGKSKLWMYVRDAANGMLTYVAGPNVANMPLYGKSGVSNVEGVGHFMISNGDLTTLTNDQTLAQLKIEKLQEIAKFNPDNYIPTFQRINKDTVGLTFKKLNEITEDDIVMTQIVQIGADNINWDAKAKAPGFKSSVFSLTDKSGKPISSFLFAPTKQNYNRFSGGAYYILAETDKGLMVREMSGSIDMLHSDVDDVAKKYGIPLSKIKIGVMDAGSFSAKPQSKDGSTNFADYQGYNPNKAVGSSLNIPLGGSALDNHIEAAKKAQAEYRKEYLGPNNLNSFTNVVADKLWTAYIKILEAASKAGKIITRGQAMYMAQQEINKDKKYDAGQMSEAAKEVYNYEKGTVQGDINRTTGAKNVSVKKAVQNAIDKAYAIGLGFGKQQGFQKGATEGQKSGFITGKEVGMEQGQEMGIKEGKLAAAKTMKALLEGLKAELNPRQINGILERFAKQRDFSPEGKQAFMDYVDKVIDDANYVLNERAATKLKGRVKSMSQSDRTPANDQSLFKAFSSLSINHMTPEALQSYIDWGTQITGKSLKNRTQLMEFIKEQKEVQDRITNERSEKMRVGRERNLKEEYEKAKNEGELPDGVTTFEEFVDSKKPTPKQKTDMNARIAALEIPEETDKETRRVLETLKKQNLSLLSENDLVLLENAISNFEDTGELFAVGDIAAKAEVYNAVDNLVKQNIVFNKQVDTKAVKKRSLTNLLNKYINLSKNVAKLRNTIIQPWLTASSKVYSAYVVEEGLLLQEAKRQKLKQDNFNRIDLFGFLNEAEGNPELFDTLKEQKLSDLQKLADQVAENKKRNDKTESAKTQLVEYEALKQAIESLGLTADSKLEDLKLSEGEKKWYDEARKILDKYGARAIKNMSLYGNQEVGMVQNYWPRNVVKTQAQSDEQTLPDKLEDFSLYNSSGKVGGNLFGRQKGRTNLVGKNGYYQPDGKVNLFNGLRETMMIAMAAKEYHQMQAMYNSSKGLARLAYGRGFNTLKGTLIQYILDTKNHGKYNVDDRTRFHKFKNHVMSAVTSGLIKNITQYPKQLTALANTAAMAPQSTAAATAIAIKAMIAPKGSPLRNALESFVDSGTLGIRLSIPEMLEISSGFAEDKSSVEEAYGKFANILDTISGGKGLEWTDKQVSIIATLAGYIQNQIQNGKIKNALQFDLIKEDSKGWDGEAMSAGEQMQGKSNNENTRILFSQRQKDSPLLYFLTNFTHQMVMSAYDNVAKIGDPSVPKRAKLEALQNLGGVVMAGILFQVARSYANGAIDSLFEKIKEEMSGDDEEEKKRKRKMLQEYEEANRTKKLISSTLQETFNYVGGTQNVIVQEAINNGVAGLFEAYQYAGRKMNAEGELPEMLKESVKKDNNPFYSDGTVGQAGIISEAFIKPLVMSAKSDDPTGRLAQEAEILALKLAKLPAPAYLLSRNFASERKEEKAKDLFEKKEKKEIAEDFSPGNADEKIARKKLLNYLETGDVEKAKKEIAKAGETYAVAESIMRDKNNAGIPNKNEYAILQVAQGNEKDATMYLADGSETTVKKFYAGRPDAIANLLIKYKAQEARQRKQLRLLNQIKPKDDNTDYLKEYFYSKLND
jgi:hypothetical protein